MIICNLTLTENVIIIANRNTLIAIILNIQRSNNVKMFYEIPFRLSMQSAVQENLCSEPRFDYNFTAPALKMPLLNFRYLFWVLHFHSNNKLFFFITHFYLQFLSCPILFKPRRDFYWIFNYFRETWPFTSWNLLNFICVNYFLK